MTVTRDRLAAIPPEKRDPGIEQMRAELNPLPIADTQAPATTTRNTPDTEEAAS